MDREYFRGDLYYADLGNCAGSEQKGLRPVIIIQNDVGNRYSPTVIVAAVTSAVFAKNRLPTHCYIGTECGLELPSVILLEQLRTIDKLRLSEPVGRLSAEQTERMNQALAVSIGLKQNEFERIV